MAFPRQVLLISIIVLKMVWCSWEEFHLSSFLVLRIDVLSEGFLLRSLGLVLVRFQTQKLSFYRKSWWDDLTGIGLKRELLHFFDILIRVEQSGIFLQEAHENRNWGARSASAFFQLDPDRQFVGLFQLFLVLFGLDSPFCPILPKKNFLPLAFFLGQGLRKAKVILIGTFCWTHG